MANGQEPDTGRTASSSYDRLLDEALQETKETRGWQQEVEETRQAVINLREGDLATAKLIAELQAQQASLNQLLANEGQILQLIQTKLAEHDQAIHNILQRMRS